MSAQKKVVKMIYTIILMIELVIIAILYIKNPNEYYNEYMPFFAKVHLPIAIGCMFLISIIIYIIENKVKSKNQGELDEYDIQANFDIDLKDKDILYLSTIFNKRQPEKKDLILLIMQLINKKVIDLSCYLNGNSYQYIIEKRNLQVTNITSAEQELIRYIFKDSNRVDLRKKVDELYNKDNSINIVNKCKEYIKNYIKIEESSMKKIFQVITSVISILVIFLACFMFYIGGVFDGGLIPEDGNLNETVARIIVILRLILYTSISIIAEFIMTIILKRINSRYKYDNDAYLWVCRNFIFINSVLLVTFIFKKYYLIQFMLLIIYIFTTLTIMILYNEHIYLYKKDIETRRRLFSLRKYFEEMQYLRDKEFGNIITYEECLMYGFLFNITIKINDEFDILQKQLFDVTKNEGKLYMKLFHGNFLK